MSYNYSKNEFGKRGRVDEDSDDESEEDCSKNIFKYLMFYIFPSSVGDGRRKVLHNLIKKHGGNFTEVVTNHTTHVLVDESVSCGKICRALGWTTFPPHINVVYVNWLSDCVRAEYCLKTSDYQVPNNHKPTYVITCANLTTSKNSPDTHYIKTKSQSKLKHSKQLRIAEVVEADMSNVESVEEEESSFDDGLYDGETSCDDEWLYSVPSEALNMIIPPSFTSTDQESKLTLSISNPDTTENTGTLKLRLYRHKSANQGYEYSRYSTVNNNFQIDPISSKLDSSAFNCINEENEHKIIEVSNLISNDKSTPCPDEIKSSNAEPVMNQSDNVCGDVMVDNICIGNEILKSDNENCISNIANSSMNVVVSSTKETVETNLNISDSSIDTSFCSETKVSNDICSPDSLDIKHPAQENEASKFDLNKDSSDPSNLAVSSIVTSSSCTMKNTDNSSTERVVITDASTFPIKSQLNSTSELEKCRFPNIVKLKEVSVIESDLSCRNAIESGTKKGEIFNKKLMSSDELYETQVSKISSTTENIESSHLLQKEYTSPLPDSSVLKDTTFNKVPSLIDSSQPNSILETGEVITNDTSILSQMMTNDSPIFSGTKSNDSLRPLEVIVKKSVESNETEIASPINLKVNNTITRDKFNDGDNVLSTNSSETLSLTLSLVSELVNRAANTESIRLAKSDCLSFTESCNTKNNDADDLSENNEINKHLINGNALLKPSLEHFFIDSSDLKINSPLKVLTSVSEPMETNTELNKVSGSCESSSERVKGTSSDQKSKVAVLVKDIPHSVAIKSSSAITNMISDDSALSKSVGIEKIESQSIPDDSNNEVISKKLGQYFPNCPKSSYSSTQPIVLLNKLDINSEEKIEALNKVNDITKINKLPEFARKSECKSVIQKIVSISSPEIKLDLQQSVKEMNVSNESNLVSDKKEETPAVCSINVNSLNIQDFGNSSNPAQPSEVAIVTDTSPNLPISPKLSSPILLLETSQPNIVTFDLSVDQDSPEKLLGIPVSVEETPKISLISSLTSSHMNASDSNISIKTASPTEDSHLLQSKLLLNDVSMEPKSSILENKMATISKDVSNIISTPKPCLSNESSGNLPEFKVPLQKGIFKSPSPDSVLYNHSTSTSIQPKKISHVDLISGKRPTLVSISDHSDLELSDQISSQSNIITSVKPFDCTAVLSELPEPMDFATVETNLEATLSNTLSNITDSDFKLQPFAYDHENMKSQSVLNLSTTATTNDDPLTLTFNSHLSDTIEDKFSLTELSGIKIPKPNILNSTNLVSQSSLNSRSKNNDLDILCDEAIEMDSLISDTTNYTKHNSSEKSDIITDETLIGISALETFNDELKAFDPTLSVVNNLAESACTSFHSSEPCISTSINSSITCKPSISISPTPSQENAPVSSTQAHSKKKKPTKLFLETPNSRIIRKLQLLHDSFKRIENKWRMHAYEKAIMAVRKCNRPICTVEDVQALDGIAKKIVEKIIEIVQTGQLNKINEVCSKQREATIRLYSKVWGIGSKTAEQLYKEGHRTIRDLKLKANLSRAHLIALRYFTDLRRQIPRPEAEKILTTVLRRIFNPFPYVQCDACSSLRRNKLSTGHIDLLVTLPEGHENDHKILPEIVAKLHQDGYLIDDLIRHEENGSQTKYAGIFKLKTDGAKHRRIDITVCTKVEQACALLKLTGPTYFNKAIRQIARKRNMILDEHSLRVKILNPDGTQTVKNLDTPNENAVFQCLGLPFRSPVLRDPDKSK